MRQTLGVESPPGDVVACVIREHLAQHIAVQQGDRAATLAEGLRYLLGQGRLPTC